MMIKHFHDTAILLSQRTVVDMDLRGR